MKNNTDSTAAIAVCGKIAQTRLNIYRMVEVVASFALREGKEPVSLNQWPALWEACSCTLYFMLTKW